MSETMTVRPGTASPGTGTASDSEVAIDAPEPSATLETQLVGWSVGIGITGLIILGTLRHIFILHK